MRSRTSIKTSILVPSLAMIAIGLLTVGGYAAWSRAAMQDDMFSKKVDLTANLALSGAANAMWQFDEGIAKETLAPATTDPDFKAGLILDEKGKPFYAIGEKALTDKLSAQRSALDDKMLLKTIPLVHTEEGKTMTIGELAVVFDTRAAAASSLQSILTMVAIALGVLAAVGLAVYLMLGRMVRPIIDLSGVMGSMAEGDFEKSVPGVSRRDEIGLMAHSVEVLKENSLKARALEGETADMRVRDERNRRAEQERIAREAEQLRQATDALGAALGRLAGGDLTCHIDTALSTEYEPIRVNFNQAVSQLHDAIVSLTESVGNIDVGTSEIASGADSLSKRTEQQAAALEETAAALDEITANVSSSSKRTEEARTISNRANNSAVKSSSVVSNAEVAMQRIEKSSEQISNIISVIDEIAFQTNLLALNAGVEAARAGEAGKGFAVVAQEVRELAQRSAQAAKEIKELIQNSATEVDAGVRLVRDTGEALKSIGSDIAEINQHMEAIALSAREQSTGLSEINSAVNQMDQATQQNAAMVEESSAASATLAGEAAKLRQLISTFVVGGGANALRQTARRMALAEPMSPEPRSARAANGKWQEF